MVNYCKICKQKSVDGVKLYRIPKSTNPLYNQWAQFIFKNSKNSEIQKMPSYRICNRHFINGTRSFNTEDPNSVPSIINFSDETEIKKGQCVADRFERLKLRTEYFKMEAMEGENINAEGSVRTAIAVYEPSQGSSSSLMESPPLPSVKSSIQVKGKEIPTTRRRGSSLGGARCIPVNLTDEVAALKVKDGTSGVVGGVKTRSRSSSTLPINQDNLKELPPKRVRKRTKRAAGAVSIPRRSKKLKISIGDEKMKTIEFSVPGSDEANEAEPTPTPPPAKECLESAETKATFSEVPPILEKMVFEVQSTESNFASVITNEAKTLLSEVPPVLPSSTSVDSFELIPMYDEDEFGGEETEDDIGPTQVSNINKVGNGISENGGTESESTVGLSSKLAAGENSKIGKPKRKKAKGRNGNIYIGVSNRIEWFKLQEKFGFEVVNNFGNFVTAYMHKVFSDFEILQQVALESGMFKEQGLTGFRWVNGQAHPVNAAGEFLTLPVVPLTEEMSQKAFEKAYDLAIQRNAFLLDLPNKISMQAPVAPSASAAMSDQEDTQCKEEDDKKMEFTQALDLTVAVSARETNNTQAISGTCVSNVVVNMDDSIVDMDIFEPPVLKPVSVSAPLVVKEPVLDLKLKKNGTEE